MQGGVNHQANSQATIYNLNNGTSANSRQPPVATQSLSQSHKSYEVFSSSVSRLLFFRSLQRHATSSGMTCNSNNKSN